MSEKPKIVKIKDEPKIMCPWHRKVKMREETTNGFVKYFRRVVSAKRCPVYEYLALFDKQKIVRVKNAQVAVAVDFR